MLTDRVRMGRYKGGAGGGAIYGVRIDKNNSNPSTRVTYIGDAVGFTPMSGNNGNFQWGSWQSVFESFEIRPCVLKNRVVQYYLNPNDFTKKADNTSAVITGADGDVMIEFGKTLWWKWTDEGTTYTIEISDAEFSGAVKHAFELESGYNMVPYYALMLTQILFVLFFKSTNSQAALGLGRVTYGSGVVATGGTNNKSMFYGSTSNEQVKFLGIEDYWGNKGWYIDGLNMNASLNILIGKSGFNDSGSGYQSYSSGLSSDVEGYLTDIQFGNEKGFIGKTVGGDGSTYYADYSVARVGIAVFGGDPEYYAEGLAGAFALKIGGSSTITYSFFGSRLFCAANGKIYIGAYLGISVGSGSSTTLRSISGSTPTGNKTIATFRTEARRNN